MRCKNCGWPNKPQTKVCVKCHSPLDTGEETTDTYSAETVNPPDSDSVLNKTMLETDVFGNNGQRNDYQGSSSSDNASFGWQEPGDDYSQERPCPKCGYPLRPNVDKCPHCKHPVKQNHFQDRNANDERESASQFEENPHRRATRMDNPSISGKMRGTVNPYMMNVELAPTFVLQPMKRFNERKDFDEQEYEGKEVVLNRDNTEPGNPSITSREQALIQRIDGHWFIEDKSDQKTTFVQAGQKIELHEGDLILLGNRLFKFHE